uniref:IGF-like family receptor 1 n=1 Tax=Urocitellus parryii TaxID=9999 RepID=A0A8D2HJY2_UROPR|nr:IGF-like family receptor 1 [Urocitellus parryii]XP_026235850.1 IGF-like family receptor 1 [Urocitellus parryii]
MGTGRFLRVALLLMAQALPQPEASQYCGHLEYWNPDRKCCSRCLERFGPPPCPDFEFVENCGLNDFGDFLMHPFRKCPPGHCNPNNSEQCSPCSSGVAASTPVGSRGSRTLQRCKEKPIPSKDFCPMSSQETRAPSSPVSSSLSWTTESTNTLPNFVLSLVLISLLVLLLIFAVILLRLLQRYYCPRKGKAISLPSPGLVCGDPNTYIRSLHSPFLGAPEALEKRTTGTVSLLPLSGKGLPGLESQPLSRLLDELEVLEELIVLLDPEPGPAGYMAYGTTRHLAARYGLPATWSTFAYSLRPSRSPLRALIEMVVAREPSASLGQLSVHLAHIGREDALRVLSKLG